MGRFRGPAIAAGLSLFLFIGHAQAPTAKTHAPIAVPSTAAPTTQTAGVNPATATPTPAHTLDQGDVTAFFDGILPLQLERSDIAGASVLVMKDGNVLLAEGLRLCRCEEKEAGRSRLDHLPARVHLQAFYLDFGHAT